MAQLALATAGAYVGTFFGSPQVGWAVGSLLGAALFKEKTPATEGPRLQDLKIVTASYGATIPSVYGTIRAAGVIVWAPPLTPHRQEETVGGKGGGQSVVSYSYTATFAMLLGKGELFAVRKIWADSTLIYDASPSSAYPVGTPLTHGQTFVSPVNSPVAFSGITFYGGNETQEPDPLIEANEGAGNVSAMRGLAYIVFENLELAKFGNRIPSISVELCSAGTASSATGAVDALTVLPSQYASLTAPFIVLYSSYSGKTYVIGQGGTSGGGAIFEIDEVNKRAVLVTTLDAVAGPVYSASTAGDGFIFISANAGSGSGVLYRYNELTRGLSTLDISSVAGGNVNVVALPLTGNILTKHTLYLRGQGDLDIYKVADYDLASINLYNFCSATGGIQPEILVYRGYMYMQVSGTDNSIEIRDSGTSVLATTSGDTTGASWSNFLVGDGDYVYQATYNNTPGSPTVFVRKFHYLTGSLVWNKDYSGTFVPHGITVTNDGSLWVLGSGSIYILDKTDGTVSSSFVACNPSSDTYGVGLKTNPNSGVITASLCALVQPQTSSLSIDPVNLSDVLTDLCTRAGLTAAELDFTALAGKTIDGFAIGKQLPARSAIEPLMQAFFFTLVESDGTLKAVLRNDTAVGTIVNDDLAAHKPGEDPPDDITFVNQQELELPRRVSIKYLDAAADYQQGLQISQRIITGAVNEITADLPLVLTGAEAVKISDVLLYDAWLTRRKFTFLTSLKQLAFDPGDVVSVIKDATTYTARIITAKVSEGIITFEAVRAATSVYTSNKSEGGLGYEPGQVAPVSDTTLRLLDINLLRDDDDDPGFYVAAASDGVNLWPSAVLYKSIDAGASYSSVTTMTREAYQGWAVSVLASGPTTIFDEGNTVDVYLVTGTLSSTTKSAVLNGANAILLGEEIIQFMTATYQGDGLYTLSGLLRGRRGTDSKIGSHVVGERAVVLSTSNVFRVTADSSELNLSRKYKGVTIGQELRNATAQDFTNTGNGKKPYSPVQVKGTRDTSNNLTVTWIRRTRIGGEWLDYVDASLGETTESYSIDFYLSGSVVRTKTATSETVSYTAAEQTADGITPGNLVTLKVYQVSDVVGRGYEASATV